MRIMSYSLLYPPKINAMASNWNVLLFLCRKEKERSEGGGRRKETEEERQIRKQKERERRENETEEERNIRSVKSSPSVCWLFEFPTTL